MLLAAACPVHLDINRLVLLDHGLLHSADLGGPESLHPPVPVRVGQLGVKRQHIEDGLDLLLRIGLAEMFAKDGGIEFCASDTAESFLRLLESNYVRALQQRARWAIAELGHIDDHNLRERMRKVFSHWSEEFEAIPVQNGDEY